jgi:hypothetical protein
MAFLSIERDGMMVGCANPIYLTSEPDYSAGAEITFEVLESDAGVLKRLVRNVETLVSTRRDHHFEQNLRVWSLAPALSML